MAWLKFPHVLPSQVVVLARVIVDVNQVTLTAEGVTRLVRILRSQDDNAVILAGKLTIPLLSILIDCEF